MPPIGGGLARARVKNHRLIESWHRRAKTAQAALSGWFKCHSSGSSSLQAERNCLSIAEISTTTRLSSYHHLDNLLHHLCCDHCLCLVLFFFLAKPTDAIIKASSQAGNPWWYIDEDGADDDDLVGGNDGGCDKDDVICLLKKWLDQWKVMFWGISSYFSDVTNEQTNKKADCWFVAGLLVGTLSKY